MGRQLIGSDSCWFRRRKEIYSFSRTVFFIDFTPVCYSLSSVAAVDTSMFGGCCKISDDQDAHGWKKRNFRPQSSQTLNFPTSYVALLVCSFPSTYLLYEKRRRLTTKSATPTSSSSSGAVKISSHFYLYKISPPAGITLTAFRVALIHL